jgi:hypothetical protein
LRTKMEKLRMDIESIQYQFVLAVQEVDSGYGFSLLTMLQTDPSTTLKTLNGPLSRIPGQQIILTAGLLDYR